MVSWPGSTEHGQSRTFDYLNSGGNQLSRRDNLADKATVVGLLGIHHVTYQEHAKP